jgi:hypothetical protein
MFLLYLPPNTLSHLPLTLHFHLLPTSNLLLNFHTYLLSPHLKQQNSPAYQLPLNP